MRSGKRMVRIYFALVTISFGMLTYAADDGWIDESLKIIQKAQSMPLPEWLIPPRDPKIEEEARKIFNDSRATLKFAPQTESEIGDVAALSEPPVYIFASSSMPEHDLKNLFKSSVGMNVVILFRGVRPGDKFQDLGRYLQGIAKDIDPPPNVSIDPVKFANYQITRVPAMVFDHGNNIVTRVTGAVSLDWFLKKAKEGKHTKSRNLGVIGTSYAIAEPDLVETMKERIAKVDWAKKKRDAERRYWEKNREFTELPVAKVDREFEVDPTVVVNNDITDQSGKLIAAAGTAINPLVMVPLSKVVIIFDGTDNRQIAKAASIGRDALSRNHGALYITTRTDPELGWSGLTEMESIVKAPVYLLKPELVDRFHLEFVPAAVYARNDRLVVTEYAIDSEPKK